MDRVYISTSSSNTVGMSGTFVVKAGGTSMIYAGKVNINIVNETGFLGWYFATFYNSFRVSCTKTARSIDGYTL